jgi:hypothetical protein
MLSTTWETPPACPAIQPVQTLGTSGEFVVIRAGCGGPAGTGKQQMIAIKEPQFEEGKGVKLDLTFACPE